ncbi:MAG TPA: AI-2E family transporter [Candidatus Saccharimonadales bacterium]|nr:AI-2E family transporter [Candidatus Saccharimonadales bacterium]
MAKAKQNFLLKEQELSSISGVLITMAAFFIVLFGVRFIAKDLIAPLLMALFLSILLTPIFRWFRARGFSSGLSIFLMIVSFILATVVLVTFFSWAFANLRESLSAYTAGFKASVEATLQSLGFSHTSLSDGLSALSPDAILHFITLLLQSFGSIFIYLFFVPFLALLFLIQFDSMSALSKSELIKDNPNLSRFQYFAESIIIYIIGRAKTNLFIAIPFTLVLLLLGIPTALVWGLLTFILCFVPYIGLIIASIPPVFLALALGGVIPALIIIVAMILLIIAAEYIVEPSIQGRNNQLSMAAVLIAFIFWFWVFGPVGAILAVPLTVLMKIILADYQETAWVAALMEGSYEEKIAKKSSYFKRIRKLIPLGKSKK